MTRRAFALALLLVPACGWHAGLVPPGGSKSIGIEIFETQREVFERGLEPLLSEELSKAVVEFVGAPLATPGRADVVVRGRILAYRRRAGIRNTENELIETGVFVLASAELVDRRSGKVLVPTQEAHNWSGYALDLPVENEENARQRALRYVAQTLVFELFTPPAGDAAPAEAAEGSPQVP